VLPDPKRGTELLPRVNPHFLLLAPALWEKLQAFIAADVAAG